MKKLILSSLMMLCVGTMMATEPDAIFAKVSGSSTCYLLSKNPQVTIYGGVATLSTGEIEKFSLPLTDGATLEVTFGEYVGDIDLPVSSVGWATIYSDENLKVPAGVKVYAPTYDAEKSVLELGEAIIENKVLEAKKGYIIKATSENYKFEKTDGPYDAGGNSCLIGSVFNVPVDESKTYFALANKSDGVGFYLFGGTVLKGGKAYLALDKASGAKLEGILFNEGGEPTSINNVTIDENGQYIIYDLNGRRVTKMEKGQIYVVGNKKYLIK